MAKELGWRFGTAAGGVVVLRQWFAPPAWLSVFDMAGGLVYAG